MICHIKNQLIEYDVKEITNLSFTQVMEVFNTNDEFFILTEGKAASVEGCLGNIESVPPNFNINNKYYIGFWENGSCIAVLDFLIGYPLHSCVWIGLLLIHGELHGRQIGKRIINAVVQSSKISGYESIRLGVLDNNLKGMEFWRKMGFEKIRESSSAKVSGRKDASVIIMEKYV